MGMFDYLKCHYPLPVAGFEGRTWQTKDTDSQFLDLYEIREDGTLWHEEYEIKDASKYAKWKAENPGKHEPEFSAEDKFIGCMSRTDRRWVRDEFTGEINFYDFADPLADLNDSSVDAGWIEFKATFSEGQLQKIDVVENRPPKARCEL